MIWEIDKSILTILMKFSRQLHAANIAPIFGPILAT